MATEREDVQHAYEQVRQSVQAGDDLLTRFADDVVRVVGQSRISVGALTVTDRNILMRNIDPVLWQYFGRTQREAVNSPLYHLIRDQMTATQVAQYRRAWADLDDIMTRSDATAWGRIVSHFRSSAPIAGDDLINTYHMLFGPHVEQQRLAQSMLMDPNRKWVPKERWNIKTGYRLSDRGWRGSRAVRGAIDDRIRHAIANGEDAIRVARELEQYLNPEHAPVRYLKNGKIVRKNMTAAPRGGHGSTWARRLIRTEVSHAQGQSTIDSAAAVPGIRGIRWRKSARHAHEDICDEHAARDVGLGPGIYPLDRVPSHPGHPNCICTLLHQHHSREETRAMIVSKYRHIAGVE